MLLITEPSGAMFPFGNVTVLVSPFERARFGSMITLSGSIPSALVSLFLRATRRSESSHQSSVSPSVWPDAVKASV